MRSVTKPRLLDIVELTEPAGGVPRGTVGTVVDLLESDEVVVELGEDVDAAQALVDVPVGSVRVVVRAAGRPPAP